MTFQTTRVLLVDNMNSLVSKIKLFIPPKGLQDAFLWHVQRSSGFLVNRMISSWRKNSSSDWKKAVSEAEKVVGYPTSFLSLRYLLSDELSNVALQMRKLVGTRHPLLKTAKGLLHDSKQNLQTCGLIVLLVAKAAGSCPNSTLDDNRVGGIYPNQRCLAELTEMIHTATLIHKGVLNLKTVDMSEKHNLNFGNKMAILSGDFLLASACSALAKLNNTKVVEIISESIKKIMESQFTNCIDEDGNGILKETIAFSDWCNQAYLSYGNLLGYSCQAAMLLAGHGPLVQESAYKFGINLAYAHQLNLDLQPFIDSNEALSTQISATAAPVVTLVEKQGSELIDPLNDAFKLPTDNTKPQSSNIVKKQSHDGGEEVNTIDSSEPVVLVLNLVNEEALMECKEHSRKFKQKALEALDIFEASEAKSALKNILLAVSKF